MLCTLEHGQARPASSHSPLRHMTEHMELQWSAVATHRAHQQPRPAQVQCSQAWAGAQRPKRADRQRCAAAQAEARQERQACPSAAQHDQTVLQIACTRYISKKMWQQRKQVGASRSHIIGACKPEACGALP